MRTSRFVRFMVPLAAALAVLVGLAAPVLAHTGKDTEDGTYRVTFGASPEPSVTESILRLEFRLNLKADNSLVGGIKDAQAIISLDGKPLKTLAAPGSPASRRGTGWYDTEVFVVDKPAKYLVTLSFTDLKGKKYSVDYDWEVKDHSVLHLTGPTELEATVAKLQEEVEHADQAADSALEKVQALEARVASLEGTGSAGSSYAPGWTSPLAILGLVAGILALGGTGVAINRSGRRR